MAQFTSAALADNGNGVSVSANNTGNDILDDGGDIYRVSVWSEAAGTTPGMAWTVDAAQHWANKQYFNQTTNILHADVCLLNDGTDVWAIVAWYYSGSGASWNIEAYKWTVSGTNGTFAYQGGDWVNGSYGTTLNIDGDSQGNFVAVYDDSNDDIYALTGTVVGGYTLNNSGNAVALTLTGTNGNFPDVALYYDSNAPTEEAIVSYIVPGGGDLYIESYTLSALAGGSGSNNYIINNAAPNSMYFSNCRVACFDEQGSTAEWTVVVEESDHSSNWFIEGYNSSNPTTVLYYNTGTYVSPNGNIKGIPNFEPVVTYEDHYPNDPSIYIGWMVSDLGNANAYVPNAVFPVAIPCDNIAVPTTGTYWIVPYTLATNDAVGCLSLSGRYAIDKVFATYWNVNSNGNIYTKEITASTASSMRTGYGNSGPLFVMENSTNYLGEEDEISGYEIYSLSGQLVVKVRPFFMDPGLAIVEALETIEPALYIMKSFSKAGWLIKTSRIVVVRKF